MSDYLRPETPRDVFIVTACVGKFAYDSPQLAWAQLSRQSKKRKRGRRSARGGSDDQRPYRCKVCGRWHIGSTK